MPPILGAIGASIGIGTGAVAATATTAAVAASTSAIVAGTVLTAATIAGTTAVISGARKRSEAQLKAARDAGKVSQTAINKEVGALEEQQKLDTSGEENAAVRKTAREKQRRKIASATGRRSTILTSPLGIAGGQTFEKKELIGT